MPANKIVFVVIVAASTLLARAQQLPPGARSGAVSQPARTIAGRATDINRNRRPAPSRTGANIVTTIQGNALDSTDGALPNSLVRLRDARYGRIVETEATDASGLFTFRVVDPGTYIVELLAPDEQVVLAASPLVSVNAGEVASAVVKLPFRSSSLASLVGNTTPTALFIVAEAAVQGVASVIIPPAAAPASPGSGS